MTDNQNIASSAANHRPAPDACGDPKDMDGMITLIMRLMRMRDGRMEY